MLKAREYINDGYKWVVDMDLEKIFDKVNHDILMERLSRRIKDKRRLKLIRGYLKSGIMINGLKVKANKGTPQGDPLNPLLANIMLDEIDKELEKRGHRFCRFADDCNIYVKSKKAGIRVMTSIRRIRACIWKQWKKVKTRGRNLMKLGLSTYKAWEYANTRKGYWRISNSPILSMTLKNEYIENLGYKSISKRYQLVHNS